MNIFEVQLQATNLEETKQFYHSKLGMDLMPSNNGELKLSAGISTLVFTKTTSRHPFNPFDLPSRMALKNCSSVQLPIPV